MTDIDKDAIKTAMDAGIKSPSQISETAVPSPEEMHARIQALENIKERGDDVFHRLNVVEGMLHHLFTTYFRNTNVEQVVKDYLSRHENNAVIDPTVKGRA